MEQLRNLPPVAWLLIGAAALVGFLTFWAWSWYSGYRARKTLYAAVTAGAADHLSDSLVPDGMGGSFHVDFLLLTLRGVVVIDLRNVKGNIFGGDQMAEWTVMDGARRFTFVNPQGALYDRIAAVKAIAGDVPVEGRIVFTRRGRFP
ncbi:MAG: NERD domain-containing protein, partial [Gammaproteobacteria bacterium]|nr:NERD domain-containing protein [Gammaproteobacteria bacterium]